MTAISIPYILLGYPLVGFIIGWFIRKTFNTPGWVPAVTTILALIEAFREVYRIAKRMADDEYAGKEDDE